MQNIEIFLYKLDDMMYIKAENLNLILCLLYYIKYNIIYRVEREILS